MACVVYRGGGGRAAGQVVLIDESADLRLPPLQLHEWFRRCTGTVNCLRGGSESGDYIVPVGADNPANSPGATRWHGDVSGNDGHDQ